MKILQIRKPFFASQTYVEILPLNSLLNFDDTIFSSARNLSSRMESTIRPVLAASVVYSAAASDFHGTMTQGKTTAFTASLVVSPYTCMHSLLDYSRHGRGHPTTHYGNYYKKYIS